jgi:hypothetical protein
VCTPGPVWKSAENLASTWIRSPDRVTRSEPLYPLSYAGPRQRRFVKLNVKILLKGGYNYEDASILGYYTVEADKWSRFRHCKGCGSFETSVIFMSVGGVTSQKTSTHRKKAVRPQMSNCFVVFKLDSPHLSTAGRHTSNVVEIRSVVPDTQRVARQL